jgi:hypothetical protein
MENDVDCGMEDVMFEYVDAGQVLSIMPKQGSMRGGTMMSVVGLGFRVARR